MPCFPHWLRFCPGVAEEELSAILCRLQGSEGPLLAERARCPSSASVMSVVAAAGCSDAAGRRRGAGPRPRSRRARAWCCSARSMRRSRSSGSPHGPPSVSARRPGACIRGSISGQRTRSTTGLLGCPRSGSQRAELVEGLRGGGVISFGAGGGRRRGRWGPLRDRCSRRISATMKSRPRPHGGAANLRRLSGLTATRATDRRAAVLRAGIKPAQNIEAAPRDRVHDRRQPSMLSEPKPGFRPLAGPLTALSPKLLSMVDEHAMVERSGLPSGAAFGSLGASANSAATAVSSAACAACRRRPAAGSRAVEPCSGGRSPRSIHSHPSSCGRRSPESRADNAPGNSTG